MVRFATTLMIFGARVAMAGLARTVTAAAQPFAPHEQPGGEPGESEQENYQGGYIFNHVSSSPQIV